MITCFSSVDIVKKIKHEFMKFFELNKIFPLLFIPLILEVKQRYPEQIKNYGNFFLYPI